MAGSSGGERGSDKKFHVMALIMGIGMLTGQGVGVRYDARSAVALEDMQVSVAAVMKELKALSVKVSGQDRRIDDLEESVRVHDSRLERLERFRESRPRRGQ